MNKSEKQKKVWENPEYRQHMKEVHTGKKTSEETKRKLSISMKGKNTWAKGRKLSKQTKLKIKLSHSGKKYKPMSEQGKLNISLAHIGKPHLNQSKEKNHFWKGGITPINEKIRHSLEIKLFIKACMERDNFTCQKTGQRGGKLVVHHINNFSSFPELRTSLENGITLSLKSHIEFHKKYGKKNNSREQLLEFLNTNQDAGE